MIVLFPKGQLGNQLFQYGFISTIKEKDEKIITSKCEYFDVFEYAQSDYTFLSKYSRFILRRILKLLSKVRIISSIKQNHIYIGGYAIDTDNYIYKKGLFNFVKIVDGFYQTSSFIKNAPTIRDTYIQKANEYLKDIPKKNIKIFVHIRRGDYLEWSVLGKKNPSLPLAYYKNQIDWFILNYDNPFFIFLSNDNKYVEKKFKYIKNKLISKNELGIDLAIMSKCESAILSNSTLSWWGHYLMKYKNDIFAPKYWLGWKSKVYFPIGIKTENINYIKIKE